MNIICSLCTMLSNILCPLLYEHPRCYVSYVGPQLNVVSSTIIVAVLAAVDTVYSSIHCSYTAT